MTRAPSPSHAWYGCPPEARVVFFSAGTDTAAGLNRFREAASAVRDWSSALAFAQREGALQHLHVLIKHGEAGTVPEAVRSHAAMLARLGAFHAGVMEERLSELLAMFADARYPVMLLKGTALATTVYARFRDRPMGDFDILVRPGDAHAVLALARQVGWHPDPAAASESFYDQHQHLPPLVYARGPAIRLDLHTELLPPHSPIVLPAELVWQQAVPAGPMNVLVPALTHRMLHACTHFAWSHAMGAGGWKAFRDMARLLAVPDFEAQEFVNAARTAHATRVTLWSLHLASQLGGVETAGRLAEALGGVKTHWTNRFLERHFAASLAAGIPDAFPMHMEQRLWNMAIQPDRDGHGAGRPWDRNAEHRAATGHVAEASAPLWARVREVSRYLRTVMHRDAIHG